MVPHINLEIFRIPHAEIRPNSQCFKSRRKVCQSATQQGIKVTRSLSEFPETETF